MPFEEALIYLKKGLKVSRSGWNAKGMWIAMQRPAANSLMTLPYIYIKTASDQCAPWTPSQCDVLAEDWCLAD
jgi:hypothetical protein